MAKIKSRQYVFLSNWDRHDLKCACLFHNPCCNEVPKNCEEIELTLKPYEDIEECMRANRYKRVDGALRQVRT